MHKLITTIIIVICIATPATAQQPPKQNNNQRYSIYTGGDGLAAILLDTQTGETWRKVKCSSDAPAACWESMIFLDTHPANYPVNKYQKLK